MSILLNDDTKTVVNNVNNPYTKETTTTYLKGTNPDVEQRRLAEEGATEREEMSQEGQNNRSLIAERSSRFNTVASQGYLDDGTADQAISRFGSARSAAEEIAGTGGVNEADWRQSTNRLHQAGTQAVDIAENGILSDDQVNSLSANYGRRVADQYKAAAQSTQQNALQGSSPLAAAAIKAAGGGAAGTAIADARTDLVLEDEKSRLDGINAVTSNESTLTSAQTALGQNKIDAANTLTNIAEGESSIDSKRTPTWASSILSGGSTGTDGSINPSTGTASGFSGGIKRTSTSTTNAAGMVDGRKNAQMTTGWNR